VMFDQAALSLGLVTVPLYTDDRPDNVAYILDEAAVKLLVVQDAGRWKRLAPVVPDEGPLQRVVLVDGGDEAQKFARNDERIRLSSVWLPADGGELRVRKQVDPHALASIVYTSGTTGKPKGAVLTQKNLIHDAKNIIRIWEISNTDVLCHALPLFHVHGLCFALHTALIAGAHILMLDQFSPQQVIAVLERKEQEHASTVFMAVPSMYNKLMGYLGNRKPDFAHMRLWTSGSAPLLPGDFERVHATFGRQPVEREGMSETGMNFSNPLRGRRKPGSIGLPLPELDVRIVNPDTGVDAAPGQTGEIWLRGPAVTPGYWRNPEETAKAFEQDWFKTGDLGRVDSYGYYYLTDRIKHIIISGGENVSPKEVEIVINRLEDVVESSVVGIPDERWGEKVVAAVVKKANARIRPEDIRAHCKNHLHDWKCPKEVVFVKALPRNTMGKVLKEEVKKFF